MEISKLTKKYGIKDPVCRWCGRISPASIVEAQRERKNKTIVIPVCKKCQKRVYELSEIIGTYVLSGTCYKCEVTTPHLPHIMGSYSTIRSGVLDDFCPGISGNGFKITILSELKGDAWSEDVVKLRIEEDDPHE